MNNSIHQQMFPMVKTLPNKPSEKRIIKRFILTPKLVNVEGDLYKTVWFCYVYEHFVKQPIKKTIYTEENEPYVIETQQWVLDKITLRYNEKETN